jgi:hypothetical protein
MLICRVYTVCKCSYMRLHRKEARRKALKEKAQGTKETGKPFEGQSRRCASCRSGADGHATVWCCADALATRCAGEEFGSDYVPPESQKISPAFFKKI